jgi:hypothetical protein
MAVFTAFSDESGSGNQRGSFVVGGCVADIDSWTYFSRAWQERVLNTEPAIPYLHMVEIRREAFKRQHRISDLQAEDRIRMAVEIIEATGALSTIVSHVDTGDLTDILQGKLKAHGVRLRAGVDEPDYICFLGYAYLTVRYVHHNFHDVEKVDFVVSRKGKITGQMKFFHQELKDFIQERHPELAEIVGDLASADMKEMVPLQAADMFCWHIRQRYEEGGEQRFKCWAERWTKDDLAAIATGLLKHSGDG